jgi:hypothetical protein
MSQAVRRIVSKTNLHSMLLYQAQLLSNILPPDFFAVQYMLLFTLARRTLLSYRTTFVAKKIVHVNTSAWEI